MLWGSTVTKYTKAHTIDLHEPKLTKKQGKKNKEKKTTRDSSWTHRALYTAANVIINLLPTNSSACDQTYSIHLVHVFVSSCCPSRKLCATKRYWQGIPVGAPYLDGLPDDENPSVAWITLLVRSGLKIGLSLLRYTFVQNKNDGSTAFLFVLNFFFFGCSLLSLSSTRSERWGANYTMETSTGSCNYDNNFTFGLHGRSLGDNKWDGDEKQAWLIVW